MIVFLNKMKKRYNKMKKMFVEIFVICLIFLIYLVNNFVTKNKEKRKIYDRYKYPNRDFFGDELYSEIEHRPSKYELEIGNQIVEKGNNVFDFCGTPKESEKIGDVGELNRYFYYVYQDAESQKADVSLITCIISGDKGNVWVVYSVERYDVYGNRINASINILSLWYIEKNKNDWKVVKIKESP